ncbi:MAG: protein kinase [Acidobacteriia bacterium]|nr:protein kinase [Terriglobia bacterium]
MSAWAPALQLGPYVLLAPIGSGGMGEVWKARDTRLDRIVAIKRLKIEHAGRFEREARAIAALNHPHICQIYDIGRDYLVMEYIDGSPLRGPLSPANAASLALQIAGALEEAHARGILHRDLKPANILVSGKGAKLLDFGLAKSIAHDDATQTLEGTVSGTPAYMSPEQIEDRDLDARSDIFSFGAVLYEWLSGVRAFGGLASVLRDDPPPLKTQPELARIVSRCLRKAPAERFQTAADLLAALQLVATKPESQPSIAVLPFADMSAAKDHEWFSDGLAEEVINELAQIKDLKVIARTSAFAFKGKSEDIRRIAEALGVAHVLEGSVRKAGNRVRVTAQLIAAHDGSHLWSERFDRDMTDVFTIQDEIARAIAAALKVRLSRSETAPRRYLPALPAYEAFLKARHYMQKWTPEALARGKQCYLQAIELDPRFAQAHCELGLHYFSLATETLLPAREAAAQMRAEAQTALEIDPLLAEAHAVLALVSVLDYDWNEAGRQFGIALAGERISPLMRYFYSTFYLRPLGRIPDALDQIELALREDPLNLLLRMSPGMYLLEVEDPAGEAALRQVLELGENFWIPMIWLSLHCLRQDRPDEALGFAEKAFSLVPDHRSVMGILAGILSLTRDQSRADSLRRKIGSGEALGAPIGLVFFHFLRGEIDTAADWFEKAIQQRDTRTPAILPHIFGRQLTSSAHWPRLAKMMNLPEDER